MPNQKMLHSAPKGPYNGFAGFLLSFCLFGGIPALLSLFLSWNWLLRARVALNIFGWFTAFDYLYIVVKGKDDNGYCALRLIPTFFACLLCSILLFLFFRYL